MKKDQPRHILTRKIQDEHVPFYSSIEEMAAFCVQEICAMQPEGPYMLGGYCFWGIVALEAAQQLKRQGHEVSFLFLVESVDRCLPCTAAKVDQPEKVNILKQYAARHYKNLAGLRNTEKMFYIWKKLRYFVQTTKASFTKAIKKKTKLGICKSYLFFGRPPPQALRDFYAYGIHTRKLLNIYNRQFYPGKLVLFNTDKDYRSIKPDRGYLADEVMVHIVLGAEHLGHMGILKSPYVGVWAEWLNMYLRKAEAMHSAPGK